MGYYSDSDYYSDSIPEPVQKSLDDYQKLCLAEQKLKEEISHISQKKRSIEEKLGKYQWLRDNPGEQFLVGSSDGTNYLISLGEEDDLVKIRKVRKLP